MPCDLISPLYNFKVVNDPIWRVPHGIVTWSITLRKIGFTLLRVELRARTNFSVCAVYIVVHRAREHGGKIADNRFFGSDEFITKADARRNRIPINATNVY